MNGKYCYSWDDEYYHGIFDTEQEAITDAKKDRPYDDYVYIGTCAEPTLSWLSNEERIIESIQEQLSEDVGEAADNFKISTSDELVLAKMIDEVVAKWIEQQGIKPSCYMVLDGHKASLNGD